MDTEREREFRLLVAGVVGPDVRRIFPVTPCEPFRDHHLWSTMPSVVRWLNKPPQLVVADSDDER